MIYIDDKIQEYSAEQIAQWTAELPLWRRERTEAIKHDIGRRQSLLAYRLLCKGLCEEYGIKAPPAFVYNEHGKPFLVSSPFFSLSHCREAVACAISDQPVGVDIECRRRVSDSLIRYTMNEEEQNVIMCLPSGCEREWEFLRLWTQKEAVAKLLGTGIRDDIKNILASGDYCLETRESSQWVMSVASFR